VPRAESRASSPITHHPSLVTRYSSLHHFVTPSLYIVWPVSTAQRLSALLRFEMWELGTGARPGSGYLVIKILAISILHHASCILHP